MVRLFVRHDVADYATWRKGYDDSDAFRQSGGVKHAEVYVSLDNGNDVTVIHDFDTADAARAFVSSPELKEIMKSIGVVSSPTIWFTEGS